MTAPPPLYTDADLYRLLYGGTSAHLEWELDVSARPAGECRCTDEDPERRGCTRPYTFAGGLVKLSCSNGDRVCDYLNNEGFTGDDLDRELLARLDRAAERERGARLCA